MDDKFKSMIILQDRVFIPDHNDYKYMLKKMNIIDNIENKNKIFLKASLTPQDKDIFSDIDTWEFNIEENILPDWYQEEIYKKHAIKLLKIWAKEHIHINKENIEIHSGIHYLKDCKNIKVYGIAKVYANGNSTVNARDNSTIYASGNSKVNARGNSTVKAMDNSIVYAMDNSIVYAKGNSKVEAKGNSIVYME